MPPKKNADSEALMALNMAATAAAHSYSRDEIALCSRIIHDHFGPTTAAVSSIMLQRGRMHFRDLVNFVNAEKSSANVSTSAAAAAAESSINASNITRPQLQHALLTLIQHGLVWHARLDGEMLVPRSVDGSIPSTGIEYFQINPDAILARSRFGRFIATARAKWGNDGARIVDLVLRHGRLTKEAIVKTLVDEELGPAADDRNSYAIDEEEPAATTASRKKSAKAASSTKKRKAEHMDDRDIRTHQLSALVLFLLSRSYLRIYLPKHSISPRDRRASHIALKMREKKAFRTPKQHEELRQEAINAMDQEDAEDWAERPQKEIDEEARMFKKKYGSKVGGEGDKWGGRRGMRREAMPRPSLVSLKASSDPSYRPSKRNRFLDGGGALFPGMLADDVNANAIDSDTEENASDQLEREDWEKLTDEQLEGWEVDPEAWLRVFTDPFDSHIRDDLIVSVAESTYSPMVSKIFRYILRAAAEGEVPNMADPTSKSLSIQSLASSLPSKLNPSRCFDKASFPLSKSSKSSSSSQRQPYLAELLHILSIPELKNAAPSMGPDGAGAGLVRMALVAPAPQSTATMAMASGGRTFPTVQVQYAGATAALRDRILRNVVRERYGNDAERVVCILLDKGKLEEKQLCKLAFLSVSVTRELCARLFAASLLSLQEVPKTADRAVSRTIFLWYVDATRHVSWLVNRLCEARARLSIAREEERAKARILVSKLERSDVREAEAEVEAALAGAHTAPQPDGILNEWERAERDGLRERLRALTVAEMRLDLDTFALTHMPLPPPAPKDYDS